MFVICPVCWRELESTPAICEKCGTHVDLYSREYERRLISALRGADAETRAQICWVLGSRRKRSAVPTLIELLRDPDVLVRRGKIDRQQGYSRADSCHECSQDVDSC